MTIRIICGTNTLIFVPLIGTLIIFPAGTITDSSNEEDMKNEKKCYQKCDAIHLSNLRKGSFLCGLIDESTGPWEPCFLECYGKFKKEDDQNKCFCEYCKRDENHFGFCLKPGENHVKPNDCKRLVCTGKAKYFGVFCSPTPEMKRYMAHST